MSRNVIWVISSQEYDDKDWRTNTYRSTTLSGPPAPGRLQMVVARPSNIKYNLHYDKRSSTNSSTQSDSIKVVETHRSHSITATIGRQGSSRGASAARAHDQQRGAAALGAERHGRHLQVVADVAQVAQQLQARLPILAIPRLPGIEQAIIISRPR